MTQTSNRVCTNCGGRVSASAQSCRHCGVTFQGTPKAKREADLRRFESEEAEVDAFNAEMDAFIAYLEAGLLAAALRRRSCIEFESLNWQPDLPAFVPGKLGLAKRAPKLKKFAIDDPTWSQKLVPWEKAKWQAEFETAKERYAEAVRDHKAGERLRRERLSEAKAAHAERLKALQREAEEQHAEIDQFHRDFASGQVEALVRYFSLVLERSPYPSSFPQAFRLTYVPESRQLVVEYELPGLEVVPDIKQRRFVRRKGRVEDTLRSAAQVKSIYAKVLPQVVLRTLHELFTADTEGRVETIALNGIVSTVDKATGKAVSPCLVSVRTTREQFQDVNLEQVEPTACLRGLNASVSRDPAELAPVRPMIDYNMVDSRFIDEADVLSDLDQRPNLMELTPGEFESLITNLFVKMGLETRLTQASRDGGVDCVAFDSRPIVGGKVVIQAKRYKNTVGVAAVRDLYGTLLNEGASKGILVTTSGYGKAAFEFAGNKPMELLDGGNLLFLLREHAGIDAKIVVPEDWQDPVDDS